MAEKIHVPRPPQSAMNKNRRISDLIRKQIKHLSHVEKGLPGERAEINPDSIRTEGEAARYIEQVTARLHPAGARVVMARRAVQPASDEKKARRKKAGKKAKSKKR